MAPVIFRIAAGWAAARGILPRRVSPLWYAARPDRQRSPASGAGAGPAAAVCGAGAVRLAAGPSGIERAAAATGGHESRTALA